MINLSTKTKIILPLGFALSVFSGIGWLTYQWAFFKELPIEVKAMQEEIRTLKESQKSSCIVLSALANKDKKISFSIQCEKDGSIELILKKNK